MQYKLNKLSLCAIAPIALAVSSANATGLTVDNQVSAEEMVNQLLGTNIVVSNVSYNGLSSSTGIFSGGESIIGFESGVVLSSGNAGYVTGPNLSDAKTQVNYTNGDADLNNLIPGYSTHDSTVLEFDFVPNNDVISFQYVFSSEEYNEWVNSSFNDVFGFFLDGVNIAKIPGSDVTVSINNVNNGNPYGYNVSNPQYFVNNDLTDGGGHILTEMDGMTVVLSVQASVSPGTSHHIKMAIADAGDYILDSNVFIKAGSFIDAIADTDLDGVADGDDNCMHTANTGQEDYDNDGVGYACDLTPAPPQLEFVKMTGGGAVAGNTKSNNNFGFNVQASATGIVAHVQFNTKNRGKASVGESPLQVKINGNIDWLVPVSDSQGGIGVEFIAPCMVRTLLNGSDRHSNTCSVRMVDYSNPGTGNAKKGIPADEFYLEIIEGPSAGFTSGKVAITRGNIQAHNE